ncbi:MAG: glycoside hydrolase domain-containing protein [Phycisphaerae bacterium]
MTRASSLPAALGVLIAIAPAFAAGPSTSSAPAAGLTVLDLTSVWRFHETLRPPVIRGDAGVKPLIVTAPKWLNDPTADPPDGWTGADFDDSLWRSGHSGFPAPYAARICARGSFQVTDPVVASDLVLSLTYSGGAVVYLNGQEIARGNLPQGKLAPDALAEDYPTEAFADENGKEMRAPARWEKPAGEWARRLALRKRELANVALPARLLRKGANVLAVEVYRSPYDKIVETWRSARQNVQGTELSLLWTPCDLLSVRLVSKAGQGLTVRKTATGAAGLFAWSSNPLATDFALDMAAGQSPRPVAVVGARNGSFSGKVIVGATQPIRDIKVAIGPPAAGASTKATALPAQWVTIRYAMPADAYRDQITGAMRFDVLEPAAPAEIPLRPDDRPTATPTTRLPPGAVVPIWLTVAVPPDAKAGDYTAVVAVSAKDMDSVAVPLNLRVADFTLPDPRDFRTYIDLPQSPDTLAKEYGVEPWSERHLALIEQSMRYMAQVGSSVIYVPLICDTNMGHAESMVRWIDQTAASGPAPDTNPAGHKFSYDFGPMDKYLDIAQRIFGKPTRKTLVCFYVWDCFLEGGRFAGDIIYEPEATKIDRTAYKGKGPEVSTLDPATGKVGKLLLPEYSDPASRDLWGPLLTELAARMKKRGLDGAMALGCATDQIPTDKVVARFKEFWPKASWVCYSHGQAAGMLAKMAATMHGDVWSSGYPPDPREGHKYGWQRLDKGEVDLLFPRDTQDFFPMATFRLMAEMNIAGDQCGVGRIGADFWQVLKGKRGDRQGRIFDLYPKANWRNLNIKCSLLLPGAAGPVATARFEMFREGIQECEARITVERAILDKKLDAATAKRLQDLLDERTLALLRGTNSLQLSGAWTNYGTVSNTWFQTPGYAGDQWFVGSRWQERSEKLFTAAGEAARIRDQGQATND